MLRQRGFALPTVLISSVIMLMVLISAATASSSIRTALNGQYYSQLAREAAEAGLARATDCLSGNGYVAQWTTANPLRPNTTCSGGAGCTSGSTCFVMTNGNTRTTFQVSQPVDQNVSQLVTATGRVELLRPSDGSVWRTFTETVNARVGIDLSLNSVVFGYLYTSTYGEAYFLTIAEDGTLSATGGNSLGQLGNGTTNDNLTPTEVNLPAGRTPVKVFTSFLSVGSAVFTITDGGYLFGAGLNSSGQLGDGTKTDRSTPVQMNLPAGKTAAAVGILVNATFVITDQGDVYAAGACSYGQLGSNYTISGCSDATTPVRVALPTPVAGSPNTLPTTNIALDRFSVFLRMQGGRVYAWGANDFGQYGNGTTTTSSVPVKVGTYGDAGKPQAVQVETDGIAVYILDSNGEVYAAGWNGRGQVKNSTDQYVYDLTKLTLPDATAKVVKIATDQYSLLALTDKGDVYGVGNNGNGQLGNGTVSDSTLSPTKFILPSGVKAVDVFNTSSGSYTSNYNNTYVIGTDGKVYGAGSNAFGQLGDGTTTQRSTPVAMQVINGSTIKAERVNAGFGTAVVLTSNQKIYTVGNNSNGQLGDGTTTNSSVPKANKYTNILPVTSF